jgi:hypothetical protein
VLVGIAPSLDPPERTIRGALDRHLAIAADAALLFRCRLVL